MYLLASFKTDKLPIILAEAAVSSHTRQFYLKFELLLYSVLYFIILIHQNINMFKRALKTKIPTY